MNIPYALCLGFKITCLRKAGSLSQVKQRKSFSDRRTRVNNCTTGVGVGTWTIYPVHNRSMLPLPTMKQLLHGKPVQLGSLPCQSTFPIVRMKSAAAVVAPVLRSNAWLELILVGLAQINTARPCSRSCGPLPGWPPVLWLLHLQRERERKQVREKETAGLSQSLPRLEGPNAAYYQSRVFPTPAGLVCAAGGAPACQKVFS